MARLHGWSLARSQHVSRAPIAKLFYANEDSGLHEYLG